MSDESTVFFPRKLVKQFILKYKELECLWKRDCPAYRIKKKRHQAITQLTQLVQTYDPAATRVHVLRKIDSLRACVRREYKKVVDSRLVATCDDEAYVPTLWYYPSFAFLFLQELQDVEKKKVQTVQRVMPQSPEPNAESSEEEEEEDKSFSPQSEDVKLEPTFEEDCEVFTQVADTSKNLSPKEPRRKRTRPMGTDGVTGMHDEYDAIGINVAAKLRYLPENMRILAEKLIGDVLFQAQTNVLTAASVLITPDPFN